MEDWILEICLYTGEIFEFKFESLDEIYNFTKQYLRTTLSLQDIKTVIIIDNCAFISLEIDKYNVDNWKVII